LAIIDNSNALRWLRMLLADKDFTQNTTEVAVPLQPARIAAVKGLVNISIYGNSFE
jgi:hypothetical protein